MEKQEKIKNNKIRLNFLKKLFSLLEKEPGIKQEQPLKEHKCCGSKCGCHAFED